MLHLLYDSGWVLARDDRGYIWRCLAVGGTKFVSIRSPADQKSALRMIDLCRQTMAQEANR
jgi:hypothetical protein